MPAWGSLVSSGYQGWSIPAQGTVRGGETLQSSIPAELIRDMGRILKPCIGCAEVGPFPEFGTQGKGLGEAPVAAGCPLSWVSFTSCLSLCQFLCQGGCCARKRAQDGTEMQDGAEGNGD